METLAQIGWAVRMAQNTVTRMASVIKGNPSEADHHHHHHHLYLYTTSHKVHKAAYVAK